MAKLIRLRYAGKCAVCTVDMPKGADAWWESGEKRAWCAAHGVERPGVVAPPITPSPVPPPVLRDDEILGTRAGGSALNMYNQKREREEEGIRQRFGRFPRLAEVIVKVSEETKDTAAWGKGGRAEAALGEQLGSIPGVQVLHDRIRPGSRSANIDHIVVAPTGVWVIDAKAYSGTMRCIDKGTFFRPDLHLQVNGRSQDKLINGVLKQAYAVKDVLATSHPEVSIRPVLCFVGTNRELFDGPWMIQNTLVTWPRKLYKELKGQGPLGAAEITEIHTTLARNLRSAT